MKFLAGVDPEYLHPALLAALYMGDECYKAVASELVVTHLGDGKHSDASLHYKGRAADVRTKGVDQGLLGQIERAWRSKLGAPGEIYDLLWEDKGGDNAHFHIEYDPKARKGAAVPTATTLTTPPSFMKTVINLVRPEKGGR